MSNEKKTDSAVDWIFSQLPDEYTTTPHGFDVYIIAKAMEKEQKYKFADEYCYEVMSGCNLTPEQYENEIQGGEQ